MTKVYSTMDGSGAAGLTYKSIEEIENDGCVVKIAAPDELFLDIDTAEDYAKIKPGIKMIFAKLGVLLRVISDTPSQSGGDHRHVALKADRHIEDRDKYALQLILGSSPERELHNIRRFANDQHPINVLIDGRWKKGRESGYS